MTTVTLTLPDDVAERVRRVHNLDAYMSEMVIERFGEEDISDSDLQACQDSLDAIERGDYIPFEEYKERRRAQRKAREVSEHSANSATL
jgi:predicted transcriptional regulator